MNMRTRSALCFGLFWMNSLAGQETKQLPLENKTSVMLQWAYFNIGLILAALITAIALVFLVKVLNTLMELQRLNFIKDHGLEEVKTDDILTPVSFWQNLYKKLTNAIPVTKESTIELDHDYDGIKELDNSLPPWWLYMFYITIVFSGLYMYWYHWSENGQNQLDEYKVSMSEGESIKLAYMSKMADAINESNVVALTKADDINEGKGIFKTYCAACHLETGGGSVGPNLTDDYWLHGGGIKNIFKTIKHGVPSKGMIAWQDQLRPSEIQKIASYIIALHGTNPPAAKGPQGELYEDSSNMEAAMDTMTTTK